MIKRFLILSILFISSSASAQDVDYPWKLTLFGGGASFCDELGCFGPTGYAFGGAFGRQFTGRWSFELEGTYAGANQTLPPRVDLGTGQIFVPELQRRRVWAGGSFLGSLWGIGERSDFFIALGFTVAYERQTEKAPEGIFVPAPRDLGLKGGISAGAGVNFWFNENWGLRPEIKFYYVPKPLEGLRYTGGLIHQF